MKLRLPDTSPLPEGEVTIWVVPDCPRCEQVKAAFPDAMVFALHGYLAETWADRADVRAQLAFQDGNAPVVKIGEEFVDVSRLDRLCADSSCKVLDGT